MSNPVIFFIREHLNGYVILVIIFLFIYFAYLRRKYQKESFQAYVEDQNKMGLSKYRAHSKLGEKVDKMTRKDFINKYSPKKKLQKKNEKSAIKIKMLTSQEKDMQNKTKYVIKENTKYDKEELKNNVKKNVENIKFDAKRFKNDSSQVNSIVEKFQNNNSNKSNNSKILNLEFVDSPITLSIKKMKKINKYIDIQIETKLETSFDNINIIKLSIGEFNKQYDEVINKHSKYIMDYMYDEIITRKRDLKELITVENNKRIFYNSDINNQINKYLKIRVKDYINNKIEYINSNLTSNIKEFNKEYSNRDSKLNNINKLKDKLNLSLNQYQYINGKKMTDDSIQDTLNKLQKMNIQPKYESQYDINNSLIKQQFNNDESVLAKRYGQAYQDYIDKEKQERMLVDPGELLSNLEENTISLTEGINTIFSSSQVKQKNTVEPFTEYSNENTNLVNSMNRFDKFNNPDEFGTYINKYSTTTSNPYNYDSLPETSNLDIEGFQNLNSTKNQKSHKSNKKKKLSKSNALDNLMKSKEQFNDENSNDENKDTLLDKLMGGDFINGFLSYSLDMGNSFMNNYDHKFNDLGNLLDKKDNMMTFGLGLVILSIVLYFADITSSSKCAKCN
jgi:hypothetical protein